MYDSYVKYSKYHQLVSSLLLYFHLTSPYRQPDPNTFCTTCTYRTLLLPHFYVLSLGFGEMVPNLLVTGS